jgi:hypothetical protein
MPNDVGQGLVNRQSEPLARLLRETVNQTQFGYSSADDAQVARVTWHNKFQVKAHFAPLKLPASANISHGTGLLFDCIAMVEHSPRFELALARKIPSDALFFYERPNRGRGTNGWPIKEF